MNNEIPFRMEQENIDMRDEIVRLKDALLSIESRAGFVVGRSHHGMVNDLAVIAEIARAALGESA